ncbi:MAG: hypothetical protein IPP51_17670 [Bacteroidetes bacterium]|nr:hypothetical protein [Bacteroidota bacterium]
MKRIFFLMLLVCIYSIGISQKQQTIKNGLYLVDSVIHNDSKIMAGPNQMLVSFDPDFVEMAPDGAKALLINTADFVPLELDQDPVLIPQTENKKKLELVFSKLAAEKLEKFTGSNIMKEATLIVNGQALTVHKIRAAIHGGKMEITRCSDNACERIGVTLKETVVKKR